MDLAPSGQVIRRSVSHIEKKGGQMIMDKNKVAAVAGFIAGGTMIFLNLATKGAVPGGYQGGIVGFILGFVITRIVLIFGKRDLWGAAAKNDIGRMSVLLASGVNVNEKSWFKFTPLMEAATKGHAEMIRLLLKKGADPNIKGGTVEQTALMLACWHGHEPVVRLLLDGGADPMLGDKDGDTALTYAEKKHRTGVVHLLRQRKNSCD
jgi:hypothetical protein